MIEPIEIKAQWNRGAEDRAACADRLRNTLERLADVGIAPFHPADRKRLREEVVPANVARELTRAGDGWFAGLSALQDSDTWDVVLLFCCGSASEHAPEPSMQVALQNGRWTATECRDVLRAVVLGCMPVSARASNYELWEKLGRPRPSPGWLTYVDRRVSRDDVPTFAGLEYVGDAGTIVAATDATVWSLDPDQVEAVRQVGKALGFPV